MEDIVRYTQSSFEGLHYSVGKEGGLKPKGVKWEESTGRGIIGIT